MRIVSVYNYYKNRGGEDEIVDTEAALLAAHGHEIVRYAKHNDDIEDMNPLRLASATLWNHSAYTELKSLLSKVKPDVIHFHNTFPLISPAAYYAARSVGVPIVQTLHNFRLLCPNSAMFRDGGVCEDCFRKTIPWPGVVHRCYQNSAINTAGVAAMLSLHNVIGTWKRQVDVYVALTSFARAKFIAGGLPAAKIVVKPNFVYPDPGMKPKPEGRPFALYVGRLSENKGVNVLLDSWRLLGGRIPLQVVGNGPLMDAVTRASQIIPGIVPLGRLPRSETLALMERAYVLIVPSIWYEGMPTTIIEAFSNGLPVIASRLGSMAALVDDGRTGIHFQAGSAQELAAKVMWCVEHPDAVERMGIEGRAEFVGNYTAEQNYPMLMAIYARARASAVRAVGAVCEEQQ